MSLNAMPAPSVWPGEEQPSLLDQDTSLSCQVPVSLPCPSLGDDQLVLDAGPADARPPCSNPQGELVIVINEKLKNSKWPSFSPSVSQREDVQLLSQQVQRRKSHCMKGL